MAVGGGVLEVLTVDKDMVKMCWGRGGEVVGMVIHLLYADVLHVAVASSICLVRSSSSSRKFFSALTSPKKFPFLKN